MIGFRMLACAAFALGAAACSKPAADKDSRPDNAAAAEAPAANAAAAPDMDAVPAAADNGAAAPAGGQGPLSAYLGHYPTDTVGGVSFVENPQVQAAVRKAVADREVLRWVMDPEAGPSDTIYRKDGRIAAWSCERHNCGDHNWTVLIDDAGTAAELCYHDVSKTGADSRWYAPGRAAPETRSGDCPASKPSM